MSVFETLKIQRPETIADKRDDLQRFGIKILKNLFRIIAPYVWGPKHTDIWPAGNFIAKIAGKRVLDARCENGQWLSLPLPVYTSHVLHGPDHKRYNKDNIVPLLKKFAVPGSVAIDVGASCGQEVATLSKAVGDEGMVYCFEPSFSFAALLRTAGLNELKNVVCIHAGCGNENGYLSAKKDQNYLIGDEYGYADSGIPVVRLDDFLKHVGETRKVSCIKIDTDGFEYEVIAGAEKIIEKDGPKIIAEFESHFDYSGAQGAEALKRYCDMGFTLEKIQTSCAPLSPAEFENYIKQAKQRENMIAHDIVLSKK